MGLFVHAFHPLRFVRLCLRRNGASLITIWYLIAVPTVASAVTPMISASGNNSCALDSSGKLFCWGRDSYGQLGQGRSLQSSTPLIVGYGFMTPTQSGQKTMAAGTFHSIALKSDGTLWAWGGNMTGQLGDSTMEDSAIPERIGSGFASVAAGFSHTLALKSDGSLWAWGYNYNGQLGDGTQTISVLPKRIGSGFSAIAAGSFHSLAVKNDGSLWAWGSNGYGQLGDGTTTDRYVPKQIGSGFATVAATTGPASSSSSFGIKTDGSLWAWGQPATGQAGTIDLTPHQIGADFAAIAAGGNIYHLLALKSDSSLWAWDPTACGTQSQGGPTPMGSGFSAVAAGYGHSLALKSDGSLWAWGANDYGQLGDGTTTASNCSPKQVGTGYSAIAAGDYVSLAVKPDGSLWEWGSDKFFQLGDGASSFVPIPRQISGNYASVSVGQFNYVLALQGDGSLWAWGDNSWGQLGDGTLNNSRSTPEQIGTGFSVVSAGSSHSLAIKSDGGLWAWGDNYHGKLGTGTTDNGSSLPLQIGTGFSSIAAGIVHSLALKSDGSLWAWGDNSNGQLGDGTTSNSLLPKQIGIGYTAIAASLSSLALKADGSLWAWGGNNKLPTQIGAGFSAIATGYGDNHSIALKSDGSLWTWGMNHYGQMGDGTTTNTFTDTPKQTSTGFTAIAAGDSHSLALKPDGSVWAWGDNRSAQLGDGTFAQHLVPALVVNQTADGYLNLAANVSFEPPPGVGVPFFVVASGAITGTSASVSTTTKFNAPDVGKSGVTFVTAIVPTGTLVAAASGATALSMPHPISRAATTPPGFVLVQLTASGWQLVSNGQLLPYATGVLGDQISAQTILNGTDATNVKGAQFCVGYGASADEMVTAGRMRIVATVPDPNATAPNTVSCVVAGAQLSYSLQLPSGWSLLGNSLSQTLSVSSIYGDQSAITTVWKWDAVNNKWMFYAPSLDAATLQSYAAGKGYGVLSNIAPGEGYWVNVKVQQSLAAQSGNSFNLTAANLISGWNLVATGNNVTPTVLNVSLTAGASGAGLTSLWAWNNPLSQWYFYAPSLEAQGGTVLSNYISGKGYLDFSSSGKTLGTGIGFWVNRP